MVPVSKFPLLNNRCVTLIRGISAERLSVAEAKNHGLVILEYFKIPGMGVNTACNVIWCNSKAYTHFKTYVVYYIGTPDYLREVASWERQFFFQDLVRCKGLLEWNC